MDSSKILEKWYKAKKQVAELEEKIKKYKLQITREMNHQNTDEISDSKYTVKRRRATRSYVTKDSLPIDIWKEYSCRCNYDVFVLKKTGSTETFRE